MDLCGHLAECAHTAIFDDKGKMHKATVHYKIVIVLVCCNGRVVLESVIH